MKLMVLDGSGFLYRAYYAFPPLHDSNGHNMNVVYGFFRMILKLFLEKPDAFVIVWDSPVKTHRHESFGEYKANRKKMEDDFKFQIPIVQEIVDRLGLSHLVAPGYEADDIIATLVTRGRQLGSYDISLYSSDKDLKQVLAPGVVCVDPMKHNQTTVESFVKEFGFYPEHMVDYLALIGDASDNVPGVQGIGPKKAQDLIIRYGSLDAIYSHIDELTPDVKEKMLVGKEIVYQGQKLIQLTQVPEISDLDFAQLKLVVNFDRFKEILVHEFHFASFDKLVDEIRKKYIQPQQSSLFG